MNLLDCDHVQSCLSVGGPQIVGQCEPICDAHSIVDRRMGRGGHLRELHVFATPWAERWDNGVEQELCAAHASRQSSRTFS